MTGVWRTTDSQTVKIAVTPPSTRICTMVSYNADIIGYQVKNEVLIISLACRQIIIIL
ncbi:unnamed protein product, partial [Rotaria sp. Silwood1]